MGYPGTDVLVQDAIFVLVTFSGVFDCLSPVLRLLVFALLRVVDISSFGHQVGSHVVVYWVC